jgi:formylglycine-generating enzyme required for sulfatase activity
MSLRQIFPILVLAVALPLLGQEPSGKKFALLVGVTKYQHPKLRPLKFCQNDVVELGKLLQADGYKVTVLCETAGVNDSAKAPTRKNIETHLRQVLEQAKAREDTILVGLAGHGIQFEDQKDSFFCPMDAKPFADETATMLSIGKLYDQLDRSFAGTKVILVDACRDDPTQNRGRSGINGDQAPRPPRGVAVLFSCAAGEMAFEHEVYGHGVFFHHVLEGLRGKAKNPQGRVTFASLADHVANAVSEDVPRLIGGGAQQSPNMKADVIRQPVLLAKIGPAPQGKPPAEPKPPSKVEAGPVITNDIGMKLAYIAPGKFMMGSPLAEAFRNDDEHQHEVEITKGFYMGVHEVTQEEYEKVMGNNPSEAKGGKLPVERISWDHALQFCKKLSDLPEEKGAGRVYDLPTEAQWEFACRAGAKTPFHFGATLSSQQANFNGDYPYGPAPKGPNLEKTTAVGSYPRNAWGLFDMHGNVWEWCKDWYAKDYYQNGPAKDAPGPADGTVRVLRGGCWDASAGSCRAAHRYFLTPDDRGNGIGFRVVTSSHRLK